LVAKTTERKEGKQKIMATESKLGAEQQKHNWKRKPRREHENEGEREHESEREHEGEKEASKRASERAREGRKNPQPVPVPASLYPRIVVVRGQGTHHGDE
jgi:hypothetical protein